MEYYVVVNDEGQYSIWPAQPSIPLGWRPVEKPGGRAECLAYVTEVWSDLRPLSLRDRDVPEEQA